VARKAKTAPFYMWDNFVKPRSTSTIFGRQICKRIATKQRVQVRAARDGHFTLPCEKQRTSVYKPQ